MEEIASAIRSVGLSLGGVASALWFMLLFKDMSGSYELKQIKEELQQIKNKLK